MAARKSPDYVKMSHKQNWNVPPPDRSVIAELIKENKVMVNKHWCEFESEIETVDPVLKQSVDSNRELKNYFRDRNIPVLTACDYSILSFNYRPVISASGKFGYIFIGQEKKNGGLVAIKVTKSGKYTNTVLLLLEFMYQEKAHYALTGKSCTAPRPIGFLRLKHSTDNVLRHTLVSEFCSVIPCVGVGMTLDRAYSWHRKKPFITTEEWRDICLSLLEAAEIFRTHGIFHLDIKSNNIMLHFLQPHHQTTYMNQLVGWSQEGHALPSGSSVRPIIIDYGFAQSGNRDASYKCTTETRPQIPPELCLYSIRGGPGHSQHSDAPVLPHPTSDLHSIAYVISTISKELNMADLSKDMEIFMRYKPHQRDLGSLQRCVRMHFNEFIRRNNQSGSYKPSKNHN